MLGLPRSTEVNRRVSKEKIYANTTMTTQLRDIIKKIKLNRLSGEINYLILQ